MSAPGRSGSTVTIVAACLATAMLMLDISVINTALSEIADGLDTGLSGLQWVVDAYTIPLAATVLTAGAIADRFGRRRLFLIGLAVFTVSSALCGAAGGIEMLVASRAIQGLGASMMFATALALISQVTPDRESRGKALAAYGAAIGASFALGPFIGGGLTELFGWRAIFLVNVPIGAIVLWITYRSVAEGRDPTPRRIDLPGQITLIGGLFLLVLALLRGNDDGWGSAGIVAALAGAVVLLIAFVVIEGRSREPMLPLRLMRRRPFAGAQVAVFAIAASFFAVFLYLTLYLQTVLGMSPIETGLVYLPGTFLVFVVSGMTAQLGANFSSAKIASVGLALVSAGLALMLIAGVDSSWTVLLPGPAGDERRDRAVQPDRKRPRPQRAAGRPERPRRRRQRHLPPDRRRGRDRGARDPRARERGARRRPPVLRRRPPPRADRERRGRRRRSDRDGLAAAPRRSSLTEDEAQAETV